jgi:hypothetical protein
VDQDWDTCILRSSPRVVYLASAGLSCPEGMEERSASIKAHARGERFLGSAKPLTCAGRPPVLEGEHPSSELPECQVLPVHFRAPAMPRSVTTRETVAYAKIKSSSPSVVRGGWGSRLRDPGNGAYGSAGVSQTRTPATTRLTSQVFDRAPPSAPTGDRQEKFGSFQNGSRAGNDSDNERCKKWAWPRPGCPTH